MPRSRSSRWSASAWPPCSAACVVTETVFNIPGLGRLATDAIQRRDYPVVQGLILVFSVGLCRDQPPGRSQLRAVRSAGPVLMSMAGTVIDTWPPPMRLAATPARRIASFLAKHPAILIGGAVLSAVHRHCPAGAVRCCRIRYGSIPCSVLRTPSLQNPFGTDQFGRSTLSRDAERHADLWPSAFVAMVTDCDRSSVRSAGGASYAGSTT